MAPFKYEEEFKSKLEKRSLQPSANAWETLSDRLEEDENQTNKTLYWWLGVAASLIGVALIAFQFFNTEIEVEKIEVATQPEIIQNEIPENEPAEIVNEPSDEEREIVEKSEPKTPKPNLVKPKKAFIETTETHLAKVKSDKKEAPLNPIQTNTNLSFEDQKIEAVVAQVKALNKTQEVTEADIDALLKEAQQDILLNKLINSETGVVDANVLLQDVEAELDQSFRMRVFEAVKESYITVKTAVAQRND
ncbi:hypothetical protein PK35_10340 [Tamlana nanhaiensis]|uniref:Uncharacterized protein n=1 Tax=Neotamlana nanhaiensis TaxID=1382798 RepID=A0A0D7W0C2_9FLAO|nr:hypothetical protein [Tamlana nanhaiensis]KJD32590.1 hypothetical protein PK35_10340 [Tamlana nanhaiensis]